MAERKVKNKDSKKIQALKALGEHLPYSGPFVEPKVERITLFEKEQSICKSQEKLEQFAADLVQWAETDPNAFKISQFTTKKRITRGMYHEWITKYPILKEAHEIALEILGNRRESGAIGGAYPVQAIMPYLHIYDHDYRHDLEWKASLRQKEESEKNEQRIVVIERYPESDLVPKKGDRKLQTEIR